MIADQPFREGDKVVRHDNHLMPLTVTFCVWWTRVDPRVEPYWYVEASNADENYRFSGDAKYLTKVES